jgi:hypothetical protein
VGFGRTVISPCHNQTPRVEEAAEKFKFLSFQGTLRADESLILVTLKAGEIPRFARNYKIDYLTWARGSARPNLEAPRETC